MVPPRSLCWSGFGACVKRVSSKKGLARTSTISNSGGGLGRDALAPELHDEPKLSLSQQWLGRPDDPEFADDVYRLPDLDRPLPRQLTR